MKEISFKHKRFCEEYCVDGNGTQAYIRSGYNVDADSARRASSKLLKRNDIQSYIAQIQAELSEKTGISQAWVLNNLKSISDRCMQVEIITDKEGKPTGEFKFDPMGATKANELIGKNIGMFKDKSELEVKVTKKLEDFFS